MVREETSSPPAGEVGDSSSTNGFMSASGEESTGKRRNDALARFPILTRLNLTSWKKASANDDKDAEASEVTLHDTLPPSTPAKTPPSRRRVICIRVCIIIAIFMVVFSIIFIPIFIHVLLPKLIQDNFANSQMSTDALVFTEISVHNISQESVLFSFAANIKGVSIPFNIPFDMKPPSDWNIASLYNDPVIDQGADKSWKTMMSSKKVPAELKIRDGKANLGARYITLDIPRNGSALAAFVAGLSQVFAANDAEVVPKMLLEIVAGFKFGLVDIKPIPLSRVIDVGQLLLASGFLSDAPNQPQSNAPATTLTPLPLKVLSTGAISSGLKFDLAAGLPIGIHLTNITFDLALDANSLARCSVPLLKITPGDLSITIPMSITINTMGSLNAILAQASLFMGARNIGVTALSALNENGERVGWLDRVLGDVDFMIPLSRLRGVVSTVLVNWILSLLRISVM
ncbi:hypothetical protein HDU67_002181 [Dinochytrium kinnereticum]|nr:hypothetical protein HDU67_002181 [Dinochytrium kinnereticum]